MEPGVYDITLPVRGSWRLNVILNEDQAAPTDPLVPLDITDCEARMEVRATPGAANPPMISISETASPDGYIVVGDTDGTLGIFISADATGNLTGKSAAYDLFVEFPNGEDVWKVLKGSVTIDNSVTDPSYD